MRRARWLGRERVEEHDARVAPRPHTDVAGGGIDGLAVGAVSHERLRACPGRLELRDVIRKLRLVARDEGELVAERGELAGGGRADAGAHAEDDGGLAE